MTACLSVTIVVRALFVFFFFNDTATTEIYTLSLHDALPIYLTLIGLGALLLFPVASGVSQEKPAVSQEKKDTDKKPAVAGPRSEEHTSELQSQSNLVCRLLLEKKKKRLNTQHSSHTNSDTMR